jgi:hypothetical protein
MCRYWWTDGRVLFFLLSHPSTAIYRAAPAAIATRYTRETEKKKILKSIDPFYISSRWVVVVMEGKDI